MRGLTIASDELRADVEASMPVASTLTIDDIRDWQALLNADNDPEKWGLTNHAQRRNDCQPHSVTSCIEVGDKRSLRYRGDLSRTGAYCICEMFDGSNGRNQGTSIQSGAKLATEYGAPLETEWTYDRYLTRPADVKREMDRLRGSAALSRMPAAIAAPPWETALAYVAFGCPITWGTWWGGMQFTRASGSGALVCTGYNARMRSGPHATCPVFVSRNQSGEWFLKCMNSDGNGYFFVNQRAYQSIISNNPFGAYVLLRDKDPVKEYYDATFPVM